MGMTTAYMSERAIPSRLPKGNSPDRSENDQRSVREAVCMTAQDVGVIIVAAGSSSRTEGDELKQFRWIGGKPMLLAQPADIPGADRRGNGSRGASKEIRG
jgi:hypothetical protein